MADDEAACVEIEVRIGKFGGSPIPDETTASLQFRNERLRQMRDCAIKAGGRYASNADFTDQHNFSTYAKLVIPVKVMRAMSLAVKRTDLEVLDTTLLEDKGRAADGHGDNSETLCYFLAEGEDGRTLRAPAPKTGFEMLCFLKHYCSFVKATVAEAELVYGPKESAVSKNSSKTSISTSASSGNYEDAPAATAAQDAANAPAVDSVVKTTTPASLTSSSAEELESLAVEFLRNTPLSLLRTVTESGMDAPNERARLSVQNWDDFDDEETRKAYPPAPPSGEISTGKALSRDYLRYPDSVDEFAASLVGPLTAKRRSRAMFWPERVVMEDFNAEYAIDPEVLEKESRPRWNAVRGRAARVEPPEHGRSYVPPRLRPPPRVVPATPSRIILHVTEVPGMYKRRFADPVFEAFAEHDVAFRDKLVGGFTSPLPVPDVLETPFKKLHAHQHRLLLRNGLLNRSWFPSCRNAPRYGGETAALRAIFGSAVRVLGETWEAIFRGDGGRLWDVAMRASGGSAEETHLKVGHYVAVARDELCLRALEGIVADRDSDRGSAACARFALDPMWKDLEGDFVAREEVDEKPTTFGPIPKQHSFEPEKRTRANTDQELVPPARASTASTSAAVEPRNPLWAPRGNDVCPAETVGGPENKAGNGAKQPVDGQEKLHEPDGEETQLYPLLYFMVKERLWRSAKYVIQNLSWRRDGAGKREQYRSCLWLRRRVVHDIEKWVDRHTWVMISSWIPEEGTGRQLS
mmetsp:Transcript_4360/g.10666  ORF Transcript_4360/g.10666 Transcript_4360/m.10666 type:complete len:749 (+) Transcript_4360:195-2441(+)|eukprot:g3420.t1